MAEIWDILDFNGNKTGKTIERGQALEEGEYHLVVHIYIINKKGEYLIQKRSMKKELMPGKWDITGGSVISGEDSMAGAIRETKEELGMLLLSEDMEPVARLRRTDTFVDIWAVYADINAYDVVMQEDEVDEVRFVSPQDMMKIIFEAEYRDESYRRILEEYIKKEGIFERRFAEKTGKFDKFRAE